MALDRRAMLLAVPLIGGPALVGGLWFLKRLNAASRDEIKSSDSKLIGQPVPGFRLPGVFEIGFTSGDVMAVGRPLVMHFFSSWYAPCAVELPLLLDLKAQGVPIWGIAYKDNKANATLYLQRKGNPYTRAGTDDPGRVAVEWDVAGVPQTFLIDSKGVVRWHSRVPLTRTIIDRELMPAFRKLTS
jgi:cytochrome c biogenesis protein CcmG/thiol:disulfide interchange protein DsbE